MLVENILSNSESQEIYQETCYEKSILPGKKFGVE